MGRQGLEVLRQRIDSLDEQLAPVSTLQDGNIGTRRLPEGVLLLAPGLWSREGPGSASSMSTACDDTKSDGDQQHPDADKHIQ